MPDRVSQNARRAINAVDALNRLYSGIINDREDLDDVGSGMLQDLRDAIEEVKNILNRLSTGTEGTIRSRLKQEAESKSKAQEQRFESGPECD